MTRSTVHTDGDLVLNEVSEFRLQIPAAIETVHGRMLGFSTSQREQHNHPDGEWAPAGHDIPRPQRMASNRPRCAACRWFEVRIIREADGTYVVHTMGASVVPGEIPYCRLVRTASAFEIIELLTVRRDDRVTLTGPSARAISQAAKYDPAIADAYVNRQVA